MTDQTPGPVPGPAIDLDEIEARCVPPAGCDCDLCALIAEVKQLRQERDEAGLRWGEHYNAELARLREALQAVRALHRPHAEKSGTVVCGGCLCVWPCFTEQLLQARRFDAVLGVTE